MCFQGWSSNHLLEPPPTEGDINPSPFSLRPPLMALFLPGELKQQETLGATVGPVLQKCLYAPGLLSVTSLVPAFQVRLLVSLQEAGVSRSGEKAFQVSGGPELIVSAVFTLGSAAPHSTQDTFTLGTLAALVTLPKMLPSAFYCVFSLVLIFREF